MIWDLSIIRRFKCLFDIKNFSAETKPVMMQDTPTTFVDCAAVYKSGNTNSGVYTLTLPDIKMEVKVK